MLAGVYSIYVSSPNSQDSSEVMGDPHLPLGEPLADMEHANKWLQAQRDIPFVRFQHEPS